MATDSEIKQKEFGKEVIDESIKVISNTIRKKIRFEKDRFYRKQVTGILNHYAPFLLQ